jgi:site-specific recombinase XerD
MDESIAQWKQDPYVTEWLSKVGERTQKNYKARYQKWFAFIGMSPSDQFKKRCSDLQSDNPKERGFFEDKLVEYKNSMVAQNRSPSYIHGMLTPIQSFFSAHRVPLRFKRGELNVDVRAEDKVVREWIIANSQSKQVYQHGDTRNRPLFLCLYQSGFSETDVSSLSIEDVPNIRTHEGHYFIALYREKTNVLQRTCLSEECVHDIKEMLNEREHAGLLTPDANGRTPLFVSQKGERLTVRFINEAVKGMVEKTYGKEKAAEFKTKSLRDAYNDALLRANLTQEVKDTLFGHKREGAREHYAISQATVLDAYDKAFQFLSVNHGTQARKDIETIRDQMREMRDNNDQTIQSLNRLIGSLTTENQQTKSEIERLRKQMDSIEKGLRLMERARFRKEQAQQDKLEVEERARIGETISEDEMKASKQEWDSMAQEEKDRLKKGNEVVNLSPPLF